MARNKLWYYAITQSDATLAGVHSMMDMLRYDSARVCFNAPDRWYVLESAHPPTTERWKSFGIRVHAIARSQYECHSEVGRIIVAAQNKRDEGWSVR